MKEKYFNNSVTENKKQSPHFTNNSTMCVSSGLLLSFYIHTLMYIHIVTSWIILYPHNNHNMIYLLFTLFLIELRTKKGVLIKIYYEMLLWDVLRFIPHILEHILHCRHFILFFMMLFDVTWNLIFKLYCLSQSLHRIICC